MPYNAITDLPQEVRAALSEPEQQRWLDVFNAVAAQTGDDEKALLAAWGAVRKGRAVAGRRIIALRREGDLVVVRGWGMRFTDPTDPDFFGTHFSTLTELLADYYRDAPLWYEHGIDLDYGWRPIGRRHKVEIYGFGVWAEHVLFPDHPLYERTLQEIREGLLSYSSDSLQHYAEEGFNPASGEMRAWPLAGWSLTRQPAEPGLGPVTLDGMEAVIQEVIAAPARRYPIDGGRAVVTVTACKSVYDPQAGPPAPADTAPAVGPSTDSEAREAQGDGETVASSPESEHAGTATPDLTSSDHPTNPRGDTMDPDYLATLAEFFGVEPTPEAVLSALQNLIGQLDGSADEPDAAMAIDAEALRTALQLETEADDATVAEALREMLVALEGAPEPAPEPAPVATEPARSYDYGALRAARMYARLLDRTPTGPDLPYHVSGEDDIDDDPSDDTPPPARRSNSHHARGNGHHAPPPRRSRSLYAPNVNTNRAARPGLIDAIYAGLGYRPPNFRSDARMAAIRSRLFQLDRAARADSGDGPRGAWVLNREIAADILTPLTSKLVLLEAGAFYWPMDGIDSLTIRKQVGVPGAYWAAENTEIEGDEAAWSIATLTLKELRAPTSWPNRWLRNLAPGAEGMIRDEMVKAMRLKMEYSALFGDGGVPADGKSTGQQPLGVRYTPGVTVRALTPARAPELADLATAVGVLEDADVEESESWGWISHPRTFRTFEFMRDENGAPILRDTWAGGVRARTLVDYDYHKTTGVPKNLGSGSESALFLGEWSELVVGMGMDVELVVSEHVNIKYNQTFVMGLAYVDTAVMYPEAFHVTTGVTG